MFCANSALNGRILDYWLRVFTSMHKYRLMYTVGADEWRYTGTVMMSPKNTA